MTTQNRNRNEEIRLGPRTLIKIMEIATNFSETNFWNHEILNFKPKDYVMAT